MTVLLGGVPRTTSFFGCPFPPVGQPLLRRGRVAVLLLSALAMPLMTGCLGNSDRDVIVYTALDQDFSEPIFDAFTSQTNCSVRAKFDTESTKTVNLVNAIIEEQQRPRCQVFWNNEILHTLRLQKMGLLEPYESPAGAGIPANYRSAEGDWYGFAARARVLIVNTDLVPENERPSRIEDLIDQKWKGRVGIAKPLFGTTATHCAVLYSVWGRERAEAFFLALKENARIVSGNKQVALDVANGRLAFGLTDTDDAIIEIDQGKHVEIIYPDQGEQERGALLIPNTVALIKGSKNRAAAKALIDYLLSAEVERRLAEGRSAQFPLHPQVKTQPRVHPGQPLKWMEVDFDRAAASWDEAARFLRDHLAAAN